MKASTFLALMGGLAAGVMIGIMIAPDNGEENRKEFRRKVDDFLDNCCSAKDGSGEPAMETEGASNE